MARWFMLMCVLALVVLQTTAARDMPNDNKGGLADQKNFFSYGGVGGISGIGSNGLPFGGIGGAIGSGGLGGTGGGLGGVIGSVPIGGVGGTGGVVPVGGVVGGVVPGGGSGNLPLP